MRPIEELEAEDQVEQQNADDRSAQDEKTRRLNKSIQRDIGSPSNIEKCYAEQPAQPMRSAVTSSSRAHKGFVYR